MAHNFDLLLDRVLRTGRVGEYAELPASAK
jgi:hypothetical protein